jgi:Fe(3+) dicitrate transport protein
MQHLVKPALLFAFFCLPSLSNAQAPDSIRTTDMPQIEVIGQQDRFVRLPGSAAVLNNSSIRLTFPVSGNEVLRKVSGLHLVDEEGIGMRANIGIRGLDPDRSRTVLVLEDGVPVALAPYGEPELYYSPAIDRMSGVEVLKGSGSILFGPQTIGGVINYLTANPPPVPTTEASLRGGQNGFFVGRVSHGTTFGNTGYQVSLLRKSGDGVGILDYAITDVNAKFKHVLAPNSVLGVKVGLYDESSNSTYVGITQAMFDSGLYDYTHPAPDDQLSIRRYSVSATHDYFFSPSIRLRTTAYGYTTTRNWSRQDFRTSFRATDTYDRIVGDLHFFNRTGNRNRTFEVLGIEPRLSMDTRILGFRNEVDLGVRYLYERAYEKRIDGTMVRPTSGNLREDEIRTGYASSGYVQSKFYVSDAFTVTPGIRFEHFDYERDILRRNNAEVNVTSQDQTSKFIPGIGLNQRLNESSSVFAGVHRGFAPPRVKDAISASGTSEELDAELSWNYEIGYRGMVLAGWMFETTLFYMNFENQVIPVSESSGGIGQTGASGLTNGGRTRHVGVEGSISGEWTQLAGSDLGLGLDAQVTYTKARFSSDRFVDDGADVVNVNGNTLPYAPEVLVNSTAHVLLPAGLRASVTATYTGLQYGDVLNRSVPTFDGQEGQLRAFTVIDANLSWSVPKFDKISASLAVKNVTNERYIVSRRPQGIRLGLPRFVSAGLEIKM